MKQTIHKNDSNQTRKAKKSFNRKLRSKFQNNFVHKEHWIREANRRNYFHSAIKYSKDIEGFCKENNVHVWAKQSRIIRLNKQFSLFENPEKVIKTVLNLLHNAKVHQYYPKLKYEGEVSFGAIYLLDRMSWEIGEKRNWELLHQDIPANDLSIFAKLKTFESSSYENDQAYMINERVKINRSENEKADQSYKVKSTQITNMVQSAVRENGKPDFSLSQIAYQAISSTIGEHFDNILQHAPDTDSGYLCGLYNKDKKEITILIFNFGKTIYQTLSDESLPVDIRDDINEIIENHTKKRFFSKTTEFDKETAITLLALQEGISSKLLADESRGYGIMNFIEHCFSLSESTEIAFISGSTAIKIDKTYRSRLQNIFKREREIIAFNSSNNLYEKPDKNFVKKMGCFFPGVIIETKIPLTL